MGNGVQDRHAMIYFAVQVGSAGRQGSDFLMTEVSVTGQLTLRPQGYQIKFEAPSSAANKELSVHRWSNWIAGFSGDFVRSAIRQYLPFPRPDSLILDPFAGVGTTLFEAFREGIDSVGFEINPYAWLVCKVKLASSGTDIGRLEEAIHHYREFIGERDALIDNPDAASSKAYHVDPLHKPPLGFKSRIPFFSKPIEQKVLYTLDFISDLTPSLQDFFRVALASVMVEFSNYTYEPSLSSRPGAGKSLILTAPVGDILTGKLQEIAQDIKSLQDEIPHTRRRPPWRIHRASFLESSRFIQPSTVDLVVTSPPYMNNYHYVRNTRPQLYWIGLVQSSEELKRLEEKSFGKFWQTVRGRGVISLDFALEGLEEQIERLRSLKAERGVYGGGGWANYVATYMNDLYKFCEQLFAVLRPGGVAIVVIGNSIIQGIEIPVARYLSQIARLHGLITENTVTLRSRTGSSIVNTGSRLSSEEKHGLYDFAVILKRQA